MSEPLKVHFNDFTVHHMLQTYRCNYEENNCFSAMRTIGIFVVNQ